MLLKDKNAVIYGGGGSVGGAAHGREGLRCDLDALRLSRP